MNYSRISPEQAESLARRDRFRLIGLSVGALLIGALYLFSATRAKEQSEETYGAPELQDRESAERPVEVLPFDQPEVLAEIEDATETQQEFLETEPLREVFAYARLQTDAALEAMGIRELDDALAAELVGAPDEHRLDAVRVRGRVVAVKERPREGSTRSDWIGTVETAEESLAHFLVATAPLRKDDTREIRVGDYLRVDGLFHAVYRTPVDLGGGLESVSAPLVVAQRASRSTFEMDVAIARELPTLQAVQDDEIDQTFDAEVFEIPLWELMGKAKLLGEETDWENAPELDNETLRAIYENGAAYRGLAFRVPVSINLDTYSKRVDDNPLRLDRVTEGWIGNNTWKGPVKTIKWVGPFTRRDMLRESQDDEHRYVRAKGYFFRNIMFKNRDGEPKRSPVFVLHELEVYKPEPAWSVAYFTYGVLGMTVLLVVVIFFLLRADRRKSKRLYEDMIRRRRARRERAPEPA